MVLGECKYSFVCSFLPGRGLAGLPGRECAEPLDDPRDTFQGVKEQAAVCRALSDLLDSPAEGCRSGRTGLIRNQVTGLSRPWVRIPLPPPLSKLDNGGRRDFR